MKKVTLKDVKAYVQGNVRYKLFYSKWNWLIPEYIKEQIVGRINSMDIECFNDGSCKECGCRTTHLQMTNKACDGNCYPIMVNKSTWEYMKKDNIVRVKDGLWKFENDMFKSIVK